MAKKSSEAAPVPLPFSIQTIYFRSTLTNLVERFNPSIPNQQLFPIARNAGVRIDCKELKTINEKQEEELVRLCAFTTMFEFAYMLTDGKPTSNENEQEEAIVAKIRAEITAEYLISAPEFPSEDLLKSWASNQVILHSWPYWREFCQSAMLRMNLPVVTLPLMVIGAPPEKQ